MKLFIDRVVEKKQNFMIGLFYSFDSAYYKLIVMLTFPYNRGWLDAKNN
jgi:hypothetical protein